MQTQSLASLDAGRSDPSLPIVHRIQVPRHQRMGFFPRVFGHGAYMEGEARIYDWMRRLSPDYTGGFWEFYDLSNGGFFLAPSDASCSIYDGKPGMQICVAEGNGFEGILSPEASGIVATAFAVNHMLFGKHHHLEDAYYQLADFIASHPECSAIRGALD